MRRASKQAQSWARCGLCWLGSLHHALPWAFHCPRGLHLAMSSSLASSWGKAWSTAPGAIPLVHIKAELNALALRGRAWCCSSLLPKGHASGTVCPWGWQWFPTGPQHGLLVLCDLMDGKD